MFFFFAKVSLKLAVKKRQFVSAVFSLCHDQYVALLFDLNMAEYICMKMGKNIELLDCFTTHQLERFVVVLGISNKIQQYDQLFYSAYNSNGCSCGFTNHIFRTIPIKNNLLPRNVIIEIRKNKKKKKKNGKTNFFTRHIFTFIIRHIHTDKRTKVCFFFMTEGESFVCIKWHRRRTLSSGWNISFFSSV
jgi:hypothetical protein